MDTFSVGVTIRLVDQASAGIAAMARQLTKGETAAAALNARLSQIGSKFSTGLVLGSAGAALAAPLIHASKVAEGYTHQLNQMRSAGLSNAEMAASVGAAWQTSGKVITSTVTENLKVISDLRTVLGSTREAVEYLPTFAKMQGAYASVLDGKLSHRADELTFSAAKSADMIGAVQNRHQLNDAINSMFRVTEATLGRVTPADYQSVYKYARQAKFGMDDEFRYKVLPEMILENKTGAGGGASGVGTQIAALYSTGVQGIMKKQMAQTLAKMGLVDPNSLLKTTTNNTTLKAPMLGADMLARNPLQWVQEVYIPHLQKYFKIQDGDTDKLIQASNQVFKGNRLATSILGELIKKPYQYERFGKIYDKTDTMEAAYDRGQKNDPAANWKALHAAFENLNVAIGKTIVPVMIPAVNALSKAIQGAAGYLNAHPTITKLGVSLVAAASGALMLGGAALMISAACEGIALVGGAVATALAPEVMIPIALAVAGIAAAMSRWKDAMKFIHSHSDAFVHIAAQAGKQIEKLGHWFKWLGARIGLFMETAGAYIGALAKTFHLDGAAQAIGDAASDETTQALIKVKQVQNAMLRAMKMDGATASADAAYLKKHGAAGLVDAIKGTGAAKQAGTTGGASTNAAPIAVHAKIDQHFHGVMTAQEVKKMAKEGTEQALRQAQKDLTRATRGISRAGGVGTSRYAHGASG